MGPWCKTPLQGNGQKVPQENAQEVFTFEWRTGDNSHSNGCIDFAVWWLKIVSCEMNKIQCHIKVNGLSHELTKQLWSILLTV